jgi:hypothetical protein
LFFSKEVGQNIMPLFLPASFFLNNSHPPAIHVYSTSSKQSNELLAWWKFKRMHCVDFRPTKVQTGRTMFGYQTTSHCTSCLNVHEPANLNFIYTPPQARSLISITILLQSFTWHQGRTLELKQELSVHEADQKGEFLSER